MSDEEMYSKMQFLANDDEQLGCYIKGHYNEEQFKRVSINFLMKENGWDVSENGRCFVGYYKKFPIKDEGYQLHFFKTQRRGAYPIMEMIYQ